MGLGIVRAQQKPTTGFVTTMVRTMGPKGSSSSLTSCSESTTPPMNSVACRGNKVG